MQSRFAFENESSGIDSAARFNDQPLAEADRSCYVKILAQTRSGQHPLRQFPQRARRPGLVTVRSAGGRERGAFRQARVLVVEIDGSARLLALSHARGSGTQPLTRRHNPHGERKAA